MILRSLLFFPANSVRMIVKAATLPLDAAIFDLEDSIAIDDKETARILAGDYVRLIKQRGIHTFVRVNSLSTGLTLEDLKATVVDGLDGVMLAKTETGSDVAKIDDVLSEIEKSSGVASRSVKLLPLIESAKGVLNSLQIASGSDRVVAVAFGAGDYYRDFGRDVTSISGEELELLYARSHIVNASRSVGVQAIDTPFLGSLTDREAFLAEVKIAVQLGFKGKLCIHPSQIEPINKMFSPSEEEVERARRIVEAFEEAQARGLGVISFEGKMVDIMSYRQAKDLLSTVQSMEERKTTAKESHVSISEVFSRQ